MSAKANQKNGNKANGSITHKSTNTCAAVNKRASRSWSCDFMRCKGSKFSMFKFLKHLGSQVAKGLNVVSMKIRPSLKVSSSSSSGRSKPFVTVDDSQRTAAIQDCIEFINSSASLPRSNSVSAIPH